MSVWSRSRLLVLLMTPYFLLCAEGQGYMDDGEIDKSYSWRRWRTPWTDRHTAVECCFRFNTRRIPVPVLNEYAETEVGCPKPGMIFTTTEGARVCADPSTEWSKRTMDIIDHRIVEGLDSTQLDRKTPEECCFRFYNIPIPLPVLNEYKETGADCPKPGVIFTTTEGARVCADPGIMLVNKMHLISMLRRIRYSTRVFFRMYDDSDIRMKIQVLDKIYERFFENLDSTHLETDGSDVSSQWVISPDPSLIGDFTHMYLDRDIIDKMFQRIVEGLNSTQDIITPEECCYSFYTRRIPVSAITEYKQTGAGCPKPGVIFTTTKGARVCADPSIKWVKQTMDNISQRIFEDITTPEECCFRFYNIPIPVSAITEYKETGFDCPKPGVIFTTTEGARVCADPSIEWVKLSMDIIDQPVVEDIITPEECCFSFHTRRIRVSVRSEYKQTGAGCPNPGVIFTTTKSRVCADPSIDWVKRIMYVINRRIRISTK